MTRKGMTRDPRLFTARDGRTATRGQVIAALRRHSELVAIRYLAGELTGQPAPPRVYRNPAPLALRD